MCVSDRCELKVLRRAEGIAELRRLTQPIVENNLNHCVQLSARRCVRGVVVQGEEGKRGDSGMIFRSIEQTLWSWIKA